MPNRRTCTSQSKIEDIVQVHQFAKFNDGIFTQYAKHPKQITYTTKLRGRPFDSAGVEVSSSLYRVRIFISNLLRATLFIFIQLQHRPFILRYSVFESDGCRIIYLFFKRNPGQNIYFKVFDDQDIYFENLQATPPPFRINCSSPNKKKG